MTESEKGKAYAALERLALAQRWRARFNRVRRFLFGAARAHKKGTKPMPTSQSKRKALAPHEWAYLLRLIEAEYNAQSDKRHLSQPPEPSLISKLRVREVVREVEEIAASLTGQSRRP